jgi:hypothetical protein
VKAHGLGGMIESFHDEASIVSDALAYSDLTTGPAGERVTPDERFAEIELRYGRTSLVVRALESASESLGAMVGRTERHLVQSRRALDAMAST